MTIHKGSVGQGNSRAGKQVKKKMGRWELFYGEFDASQGRKTASGQHKV